MNVVPSGSYFALACGNVSVICDGPFSGASFVFSEYVKGVDVKDVIVIGTNFIRSSVLGSGGKQAV